MSHEKSKNLFTAYLLWFFGGFFGLHHFYLHRDRHAFITWMTLGGYFGLGLIRDLWRLPEYINDYNNEPEYLEKLTETMRKSDKPPVSLVRYCGIIIISHLFAYLIYDVIPSDLFNELIYTAIISIIIPIACAIGVHTAGNVGRHEGDIKYALIGAFLTTPLYFLFSPCLFITSLSSCIFFSKYSRKWRRTPSKRNTLTKRITILAICASIYCCLWFVWFYKNCSYTNDDDEKIMCRDALRNFIRSTDWKQLGEDVISIKNYFIVHGFKGIWKELKEVFDSEANALKVLNLTKGVTQENITLTYRELARKWHPDRQKNPELKKNAEEKFILIQEAYETLSKIKSARKRKNTIKL